MNIDIKISSTLPKSTNHKMPTSSPRTKKNKDAAPYHGHDSYAAFDGLYLKDSHCHFDNKKHVKTLNLKKKNVSSLVLEECEVYQIIKRA
ncbi:19023_t:CDS:2 [Entrophospora sp. SA101]|nr:19023_t:CDS:2 [Entrophospora sp. SA101]